MHALIFILVFFDMIVWFGMFLRIWNDPNSSKGWVLTAILTLAHAMALPTLYHLAFPTQ